MPLRGNGAHRAKVACFDGAGGPEIASLVLTRGLMRFI